MFETKNPSGLPKVELSGENGLLTEASIAFLGSSPYWIHYTTGYGSEKAAALLGLAGLIAIEIIDKTPSYRNRVQKFISGTENYSSKQL